VAKIPKRLPRDVNARAVTIARLLISDDDENIDPRPIDTITTAKRRAQKGGSARAASLPRKRRKAIAKAAASARWHKP
jgi:hypothetical protein